MSSLVAQLRGRKLAQWAVAYVAGAWLALQVIDLLAQNLEWPHTVFRVALVLLGAGFAAVLVVAWYHGERGEQRIRVVELLMLGGILAAAGTGVAVVLPRTAADSPPPGMAPPTSSPSRSIAVLPFVNMSGVAENEYFSDGITEEILNALTQLPELQVAGRTSSFAFKGRNEDLGVIGQKLHVRHVVQGSVRRSGDRVRIAAQLINTSTGYSLWSRTYDRQLKDVFAIQEEIARSITDALRVKLGEGSAPLVHATTGSAEAHDLYLQGLHLLNQGTRERLEGSVERLRRAIAVDPGYARAYAALAEAYAQMFSRHFGSRDVMLAEARAAGARALQLDPSLAEAYSTLATLRVTELDWSGGTELFRRALELSPGSAEVHAGYGRFLQISGRLREAERELRRAVELDPVALRARGSLAYNLFSQRRFEEAVQEARRSFEVEPDYQLGRYVLGRAYAEQGRTDEALRIIDEVRRHESDPELYLDLANVSVRAGRRADALRYVAEAKRAGVQWPVMLACVEIGLGEPDRGLSTLAVGVRTRPEDAVYWLVEPCFDAVRSDPRYRRLAERLGHWEAGLPGAGDADQRAR